jgi:hypothetical protein
MMRSAGPVLMLVDSNSQAVAVDENLQMLGQIYV